MPFLQLKLLARSACQKIIDSPVRHEMERKWRE
jgi:hypothetical protein